MLVDKGVKKATVVKSKSKRNKAIVMTAKNIGINRPQYRSLPIKYVLHATKKRRANKKRYELYFLIKI